MYLKYNKTRLFMILTLILSFIIQPTLANALSTAMQVAPALHQNGMAMDSTMQMAGQQDLECTQHKMTDSSQSSLSQSSKIPQKNCPNTCQFCMSIAFILPSVLQVLPNKEALIVHIARIQNPLSVLHVPAHEPPQLAS